MKIEPLGDKATPSATVIETEDKSVLACFGRELAEIEGREIRVADIRTKTELTATCLFIEKKTGLNKLTLNRLKEGGEYGGYIITQLK